MKMRLIKKCTIFLQLTVLLSIAEAKITVHCDENRLLVQANAFDLNGWAHHKIRVGQCPLRSDYTLEASYESCGMVVNVTDSGKIVSTTILSDKITNGIIRRRPVELLITCTFNWNTFQQGNAAIKSVVGKIGGYISRQGKPVEMNLYYLNKDGIAERSNNINLPIGEEVSAVITGPNLKDLGLKAAASDCFISPDAIPNEQSLRYYLLRDMCPEDETLTISEYGNGQLLKFKTFSFAANKDAMLYMHCDVLTCTHKQSCGQCIRKWREISNTWLKAWNNRVRKTMVFDITTIQTLTRNNIFCNKDHMLFQAHANDFPKWKGTELYLGKCPLNEKFRLLASFKECEIPTKERRHQVIMTTYLVGKAETSGRIIRRRPVKYMVRCAYDRFTKVSTFIAIANKLPTLRNGTIEFEEKKPVDFYLQLLDNRGFPFTRHVLEVQLDERIEAVIGGDNLASSALYAHATDCFVTPTGNASDKVRYDLLVKSCPVDNTFTITRFGNGQKISFNSFAFSHDEKAKLYLHCGVIACTAKADCGSCLNRVRRETRIKDKNQDQKQEPIQWVNEGFVEATISVNKDDKMEKGNVGK